MNIVVLYFSKMFLFFNHFWFDKIVLKLYDEVEENLEPKSSSN